MMETASWEDFFADISENIFLLLDGAAIPTLWSALHSIEKKVECVPLYLKTEFSALLDISPYLVHVEKASPLLRAFHENPRFSRSGIVFISSENIQALKARLSDMLTVLTPSHNEMFFRFYDPAVLEFLVRAEETSLLDAVRGPARWVAWLSPSGKDSPAVDAITFYPAKGGDHAGNQ